MKEQIDKIVDTAWEQATAQFTPVKLLQDESSHWYIVPQELWDDWEGLIGAIYSTEEFSDEWYSLIDDFNNMFSKYMVGRRLSNYQLFVSQDELKRLTGE